MAQKPIAMEQLKQILQLKNAGSGIRELARRTGQSHMIIALNSKHSNFLKRKRLWRKWF